MHSVKSIKSSVAEHRLSTAGDKLRKISSLFSLKSLRSQRADADAEVEKQEKPLQTKMEKGTQMLEMTHGNGTTPLEQKQHHHHHHHQHGHRNSNHRDSKISAKTGDV